MVTLDGQPLAEGMIQLAPTDGQSPSQAAVIHDGKYSTELARTNYKVQILRRNRRRSSPSWMKTAPAAGREWKSCCHRGTTCKAS